MSMRTYSLAMAFFAMAFFACYAIGANAQNSESVIKLPNEIDRL
jgi:hypothetical protein